MSNTKQLYHQPGQNTKQEYIICEQQLTTTSHNHVKTKSSHTLLTKPNNYITSQVKTQKQSYTV